MELQDLVDRIGLLPRPALICIDGPAGAGKTTIAQRLADTLGAAVIHLDDLYNGWDNALDEGLTVELQRIVTDFRDGNRISHRRYDWSRAEFSEGKTDVPRSDLLIIEGVGAAQAAIRLQAQLSVFVDITAEAGDARVIARDGVDVARHMAAWRKLEAAFFAADETAARCDVHLSGSDVNE